MSVRMKVLVCLTAAAFVFTLIVLMHVGAQQSVPTGAIQAEETDPIASFKTVREQLRAMQKAQLNDVAHDADADPELSAMAQRQLLDICTREEQEITLEGIMEMRGWKNPVVTVHKDSVNVLLQAETITQQESAAILELVCRETGAMSGNVKIIPIN